MAKLPEKMTSSELHKACSEHFEFVDSVLKMVKARHVHKVEAPDNQISSELEDSSNSDSYHIDFADESTSRGSNNTD
jgi:hypothetical protein